MADALSLINLRQTPQTEQADARQTQNNAGGYTFAVDDMARLRRFLVLGTTAGTFYVGEHQHTEDNADLVLDLARHRTTELVAEVVAISTAGRAPKQNPGLFALAAAASLGDEDGRRAALASVRAVARTGTTVYQFVRYCEQLRGWGRGLRSAIAGWYTEQPVDTIAYQAVKYRQREGWTHRDLLRLAHPTGASDSSGRRALFDWICGRGLDTSGLGEDSRRNLRVVEGYLAVQAAPVTDVPRLVAEYGLPWEAIPDAALGDRAVWQALLDAGMPQTALIRNLPRLTKLGMVDTGREAAPIAAQLVDAGRLRRARVHPVSVLIAARTYASGHSAKGDSTWTPSRVIIDALDAAFYAAFGAVEPAGTRLLLALDVSGSMATSSIAGIPMSAREASAAMALVTAATEPDYEIVGFTGGVLHGQHYGTAEPLTRLTLSPRQRLDDAIRSVADLPMGPTDCAQPMLWALANNVQIDTFVIYTDNETYCGSIHPYQALRQYRERTGIAAKLIVVAMTSTGFSIADPADPAMLDVAGFDAAIPSLITDFARGL